MAGKIEEFRRVECARYAPRVVNEELGLVIESRKTARARIAELVERMKGKRDGKKASKES